MRRGLFKVEARRKEAGSTPRKLCKPFLVEKNASECEAENPKDQAKSLLGCLTLCLMPFSSNMELAQCIQEIQDMQEI